MLLNFKKQLFGFVKIAGTALLLTGFFWSCHRLGPSNELPDAVQLTLREDPKGNESVPVSPTPTPIVSAEQESFAPENEAIGSYKGYAAISNALASRLVEPGTSFDLAYYLDGSDSGGFMFPGELFKLLGSYQSDGLRSDFQNGQPNGINLLVWHLALSGLGDELGLQCVVPPVLPAPAGSHPPIVLQLAPKNAVKGLCGFAGLTEGQRAIALDALWRTLTGWELPESERLAWLEWAKSPELSTLRPEELLSALTEAALFNPHLLLRN